MESIRATKGAGVSLSARPTIEQLHHLLERIITRVMKLSTRQGYLIEEEGMSYLVRSMRTARSCLWARPKALSADGFEVALYERVVDLAGGRPGARTGARKDLENRLATICA
jgi:hypothetical protein